MYRKHLKMARGEGESQQTGLKSHFVERMVKLPVVHVAWDYAANTYTHIKESNKLVNFTLTNAEKSVNFVAEQAKPVVLKFEKQIQAVDNLACKGLGTLEEKVPFITKPPEQILGETKKLYSSTISSRLEDIRNYGNNKVKSVADYGFQKAVDIFGTQLVQSAITSVDGALLITEHCIDLILPPTEDEAKNGVKKEDEQEKISVLSRLGHLSHTLRIRTYQHLLARFRSFQEKGQNIIPFPDTLVKYARTSVGAINNYTSALRNAISQDDAETPEEKSTGPKLSVLTRLITKFFISVYTQALALLPSQHTETKENNSQELVQSPTVVTAVKDRILQVFGILRLVPVLLPMYIVAFLTWFNPQTSEEEEHEHEVEIENQENHVQQTIGSESREESH